MWCTILDIWIENKYNISSMELNGYYYMNSISWSLPNLIAKYDDAIIFELTTS